MYNYKFYNFLYTAFTTYLKAFKICQQNYLQNTQKKVLIFPQKLCND